MGLRPQSWNVAGIGFRPSGTLLASSLSPVLLLLLFNEAFSNFLPALGQIVHCTTPWSTIPITVLETWLLTVVTYWPMEGVLCTKVQCVPVVGLS